MSLPETPPCPLPWRHAGLALVRAAAAAVMLLTLSAPPAALSAPGQLPPREAVHAVAERLRLDPELNGMEHSRELRWKKPQTEAPRPAQDGWFLKLLQWIGEAMSAIAEGARWLVWLLGAVLVAVLIVTLRRWAGAHGMAANRSGRLDLPARVGNLDVRPETLPDRIGAAARELWLQGQRRAALSLLYRGALSRLIHDHAVPIRAAHTESECLGLAQRRLAAEQGGFFAELVRVWQLAVYGARDPDSDHVLSLCTDFDRVLDPPRAGPAPR